MYRDLEVRMNLACGMNSEKQVGSSASQQRGGWEHGIRAQEGTRSEKAFPSCIRSLGFILIHLQSHWKSLSSVLG